MTNTTKQNQTLRENALIYANAYLNGFHQAIEKFYKSYVEKVVSLGFPLPYLSLFGKTIEKVSLKVFVSEYDFYLFFIKPSSKKVEIYNHIEDETYNREWTFKTPQEIKLINIRKKMRITPSNSLDYMIVSGINRYLLDKMRLNSDGLDHGNSRGVACGKAAEKYLPSFEKQDAHTKKLLAFRRRYEELETMSRTKKDKKGIAQKIGHDFEVLIREIFDFYGWQTQKVTISGESNDFTGIYEGNHILGEVRWCTNQLDGDSVRAFTSKLIPRQQSIGLLVSYSGYNSGAYSVSRRNLDGGITVIFFGKEEIDTIIKKLVDPGELFSKKLRDAYDFLLEKN